MTITRLTLATEMCRFKQTYLPFYPKSIWLVAYSRGEENPLPYLKYVKVLSNYFLQFYLAACYSGGIT